MERLRYPSEETRKKMSESHKGARNGMYRKHRTPEERKKISEALKRYWKSVPK